MSDTLKIPMPDGTIFNAYYWATEETLIRVLESSQIANKYLKNFTDSNNDILTELLSMNGVNKKTSDKTVKAINNQSQIINSADRRQRVSDKESQELVNRQIEMLRSSTRSSDTKFEKLNNSLIETNESTSNYLKKSQNEITEFLEDANKNTIGANTLFRKYLDSFDVIIPTFRDLYNIQKRTLRSLNRTFSSIARGLFSGNLTNIATSLGGIVGLGTAAGTTAGIIEEYAKQLNNLVSIGAGVGEGFMTLRSRADAMGMGMGDMAEVISGNIHAIRGLGNNTNEASAKFSELVHGVAKSMEAMNQYGLSNKELATLVAEEIEIRKRSGMSTIEITNSLNDAMNQLMFETTAIAHLTGQDRREMLRNRHERSTEAVRNLWLESIGDLERQNIAVLEMMSNMFGPEFGPAISEAIIKSLEVEGTSIDLYENMRELLPVMGPELSDQVRNFADFFKENFETLSTDEMRSALYNQIAGMNDSTDSAIEHTRQLSRIGTVYPEVANQIASMIASIRNFNQMTQEEIAAMGKAFEEDIADADFLSLSSNLEKAANSLRTAALATVTGLVGMTDANENFPSELNNFIRGIDDSFSERGLVGGMWEFYKSLNTATQALIGLAAAVSTIAGTFLMIGFGAGILSALLGRGLLPAGLGRMLPKWLLSSNAANKVAAGRSTAAAGAGAAAAAGSSAAAKSGLLGKMGTLLGRLALPLAIGIPAVQGAMDQEYKDADMSLPKRAIAGIGESVLGMADFTGNAVIDAIPFVDNVSDPFLNTSGWLRERLLESQSSNPNDNYVETERDEAIARSATPLMDVDNKNNDINEGIMLNMQEVVRELIKLRRAVEEQN